MARCKSCGREIRFVRLDSGKWMPCDLRPVNFTTDPDNIYVSQAPGEPPKRRLFVAPVRGEGGGMKVVSGYVVTSDNYTDRTGYIPHWATCPHAAEHRKKV